MTSSIRLASVRRVNTRCQNGIPTVAEASGRSRGRDIFNPAQYLADLVLRGVVSDMSRLTPCDLRLPGPAKQPERGERYESYEIKIC